MEQPHTEIAPNAMSPLAEAMQRLDTMAASMLNQHGLELKTKESKYLVNGEEKISLVSQRRGADINYWLEEGQNLDVVAWSPGTNEQLARITNPDGSTIYRHDSLWFGADDSGSFVTMWQPGDDNVETYSYSNNELQHIYQGEYKLSGIEGFQAGLQRSFPDKPKDNDEIEHKTQKKRKFLSKVIGKFAAS